MYLSAAPIDRSSGHRVTPKATPITPVVVERGHITTPIIGPSIPPPNIYPRQPDETTPNIYPGQPPSASQIKPADLKVDVPTPVVDTRTMETVATVTVDSAGAAVITPITTTPVTADVLYTAEPTNWTPVLWAAGAVAALMFLSGSKRKRKR